MVELKVVVYILGLSCWTYIYIVIDKIQVVRYILQIIMLNL